MKGSTCVLVACTALKAPMRAPAGDLYQSPWFQLARAAALARGDWWRILSAKHGLLDPAEIVQPYNMTLHEMRKRDRIAWADQVCEQLLPQLTETRQVIVLAGELYREHLVPRLQAAKIAVELPLKGMGLGYQKQFLKQYAQR